MIRLLPYYERDNGQQMLECWLQIVADVVPFFREDVLDSVPRGTLGKPKTRSKAYQAYLKQKLPGIPDGTDEVGRKQIDAQLAELLLKNYSAKLHDYLYEGCIGDGHINPGNLRALLTVRLEEGQVPEEMQFDDCRDGTELLSYVFRYDALSKHKDIYNYVTSIGAEVCPYCNRLFTTTVTAKSHKTRPQLDHFRNKNKYPYLALSINNLIPSCGVCNLLKHNDDLDMVYPYGEGMGDAYSFRTTIPKQHITTVLTGARVAPEDFDLTLAPNLPNPDSQQAKRIQNSIEELALKPLYDSHKEYVADLYFQRYVLTDELIRDLQNQFSSLFTTEEEVRASLLSTYVQEDRWGDRPLSKLTHDIQEEIETLYAQIHPPKA